MNDLGNNLENGPFKSQLSAGKTVVAEYERGKRRKRLRGLLQFGAVTTSILWDTEQFVPDFESTAECTSN